VVLVEELSLEAGEEGFGHRVVIRVADTAHRSEQAGVTEPVAEKPAGVLSPVVGMGDGLAGFGPAPPGRHLERIGDELGADVICDRPAHTAAGPGVDHRSEIHLALPGGVFGDVHDPEPVRARGIESPFHQVRVRVRAVTSGAAPVGLGRVVQAHRTALAHQPLGAGLRTAPAHPQAELVSDPRGPIGPT